MQNIIEMGSHAVNSSCLPLLLKINYYAYYAMYISIIFFIVNKCGHRNVLSKRQVWISIFHIINFKKRGPGFF